MQFNGIHRQLLRRHHLFYSLTDDEMEILLGNAYLISQRKGDYLFHQGEKATRFYFMISGCVRLFRNLPDGTEKVIELFHHDDTFGEALMFTHEQDFPVSAQAIENTELLSFANDDYLSLLRSNPDLCVRLLGDLSERLRALINEIEMLSLKNSTLRVVRYLLNQLAKRSDRENSFELAAAKHLIASQLAIQPETFSRIIHRLKAQGIIDVSGKRITVLNQSLLANYEKTGLE